MNFNGIRSLRGQILATASLFIVCVPVALGIIWQRPRFEASMQEKYTANYAEFDEALQSLCAAAERGSAPPGPSGERGARFEPAKIAALDPVSKELLFQDWMQRRQPPRPRTPRALVAADPEFFLRRAEQSVVCGNSQQRAWAFEFLELCESPLVIPKLERLSLWASRRQIPDLPEQIDVVVARIRKRSTANHATGEPTPGLNPANESRICTVGVAIPPPIVETATAASWGLP